MKTIGENIRELRTQNNMTMVELASIIGVKRKTILNIEKNRSAVKSDYVYAICDEFNITPNKLYGWEE